MTCGIVHTLRDRGLEDGAAERAERPHGVEHQIAGRDRGLQRALGRAIPLWSRYLLGGQEAVTAAGAGQGLRLRCDQMPNHRRRLEST